MSVTLNCQSTDIRVSVTTPAPIVATLQVGQGPAGAPGAGGVQLPPLVVSSSRALVASDAGRVLQLSHNVTLTIPAGLPSNFACQLLMPAAQVWAGGLCSVDPDPSVLINGGTAVIEVERLVGSSSPWLAWLQRESAANAYSLIALGADLSAAVVASFTYETGVYETGVYE